VAYDEDLADRVRAVLPAAEAVTERLMFGGLAFMLGGHMFCGVVKDTLMVRLGAGGRRGGARSAARAADGLYRPGR
jgi:hypothetical protein